MTYYKKIKSIIEWIKARNWAKLNMPLTPLKAAFLDTGIRSFVKDTYNMNIKKAIAWGLISATKLFFVFYIIIKEARYIKIKIKKLKAAKTRDVELQYYKNLAEKRF